MGYTLTMAVQQGVEALFEVDLSSGLVETLTCLDVIEQSSTLSEFHDCVVHILCLNIWSTVGSFTKGVNF